MQNNNNNNNNNTLRSVEQIALNDTPSQHYEVSLAVWDHRLSVTFHPTQVSTLRLNPGGIEG